MVNTTKSVTAGYSVAIESMRSCVIMGSRQTNLMPSPDFAQRYRPLLLAIAIIFAAATILYSGVWMYYARQGTVELGIDTLPTPSGIEIRDVYRNSPAERAGLRAHDLIVALNGRALTSEATCSGILQDVWLQSSPGDHVVLKVARTGEAQPLVITGTFRAAAGRGDQVPLTQRVANLPSFFPLSLPFLSLLLPLLLPRFLFRSPSPSPCCALLVVRLACRRGHPVRGGTYSCAIYDSRSKIDCKRKRLAWTPKLIWETNFWLRLWRPSANPTRRITAK